MVPYYQAPDATIYNCDVRAGLDALPDGSVHLALTSPPYWGLRKYAGVQPSVWGGDSECRHEWGAELPALKPGQVEQTIRQNADGAGKGQRTTTGSFCRLCSAWLGTLGNEPTPDWYVAHLVDVFRRLRRVLRDDGCLVLNLGDSYAGSWGNYAPGGIKGVQRARTEEGQRWERPAYADTTWLPATANVRGVKGKNLLEMPSRVVLALQADGWILRSRMPWPKRNCLPESVLDRPTTATEYLFQMTRGPRCYWDKEAVAKPAVTAPHAPGNKTDQRGDLSHGQNWMGLAEPDRAWDYNPAGRNFRNTDPWYDSLDCLIADERRYLAHLEQIRQDGGLMLDENGDPLALDVCLRGFKGAHFAVFPEALVRPFVLAATSEAGCCARCGRQWGRVVSKSGGTIGHSWHDHKSDSLMGMSQYDPRWQAGGVGNARDEGGNRYHVATLGFRPACDCSAGVVPPVVLDPFGGSGTVALVARRLGRHSILLEASEEYCQMAVSRLEAQTPVLPLASEPAPDRDSPEQLALDITRGVL